MGASVNEQREFFDRLAPGWDAAERPDIGERLERVVREAGIAPGMRVLDVGCGTGVIIPFLLNALQGTGGVTAVDISPGMLEVARGKGFPDCVRFVLADVTEADFADASFDCAVLNAVFPHFEDAAGALANIRRMLVPGGILCISHPVGREAVNRVHREASGVVNGDIVQGPAEMSAILTACGFVSVSVRDEPEFYLALARKPL